ncbi:hypothetical protein Tco_0220574, partial [Tanacetum coccineum]
MDGKCSRQTSLLKERDVEMASLKAQLSLKEAEFAEGICLRGQIATVKATEAARASELDGLKEQNAALEGQVAALESATVSGYDLFKEQIKAVQDVQVKALSDSLAGLDSELMSMTLHLD